MKIYRALKQNWLTQKFCQNLLPIYKEWGMLSHNGWDWFAKPNDPLYWDCDIKGKVLYTEIDTNGGLGVSIITEDKDGIFKHRFWHLNEFRCEAGQILNSGDLIGLAGKTGMATGVHLHRDLKPQIKDKFGNYENKEPDNGHFGAIDITPYWGANIFIVDEVNNLKGRISILKQMIELLKIRIEIFVRFKK